MAFSFLAIAMCMQDSDKTARKVAKWIMRIAQMVAISRNRISEIIGNANFSEIDNLLSQGRDMSYNAGHYQVDLALAWALRLQGKADLRLTNRRPQSHPILKRDMKNFLKNFFDWHTEM